MIGIRIVVIACMVCACQHALCAPAGGKKAGVAVWQSGQEGKYKLSPMKAVHLRQGLGTNTWVIHVDTAWRFQSMEGFGAALTDASAWLMVKAMPVKKRQFLLQKLFSRRNGIGLNMLRVPVGASDFSLYPYTYDDRPAGEEDTSLAHFNIEPDEALRLPVVHEIQRINPDLKIFASPWSAPAWMKHPPRLNGGSMHDRYVPVYARYLLKYVLAYQKHGVFIHALAVQNEPYYQTRDYPSMYMPAEQQIEMIKALGPLLLEQGIATRIFIWDHNWNNPQAALDVLQNDQANRYISGSAWHGYAGDPRAQSTVHQAFPTKSIYFTEITGTQAYTEFSQNLTWTVHNILIGAVRHWAQAALYWNVLLDQDNGPNILPDSDDAERHQRGVVQLDRKRQRLDFQVEYYALGHLSRFVLPGAYRIASQSYEKKRRADYDDAAEDRESLETIAFLNADGSKVLLVLNPGSQRAIAFTVRDRTAYFNYRLPKASAATFVWQ